MRGLGAALLAAGTLLAVSGCGPREETPAPAALQVQAVSYSDLDGWQRDDPWLALQVFRASCPVLRRKDATAAAASFAEAGRFGDWQDLCASAERVEPIAARDFFETGFVAYRLSNGDAAPALVTGYFEPLLSGSRTPSGRFDYPLYAPPEDIVLVDLGQFDPTLAGRKISGRLSGASLVPYWSRGEIDGGALDGRARPIVWVDDPIAAFFLHIQGSGRIALPDGRHIRVGYAGQNGHPYRAIGRDLVESGALPREEVSLQSIRAWLLAHPESAAEMMARNRSYIFFQERPGLAEDDGPLGAMSVPLTPGRSIAVDPKFVPLGAPVWLDTSLPQGGAEAAFRRLVVAQDVGGAIKGPQRADLFLGSGQDAESIAGYMKQAGTVIVLLPRAAARTS